MMLSAGTKLGPYLIEAPAGAGGMGEVYKAKDTRLERTVAIKVLPVQIANNEDLRTRFEREAKAISSLNHPNICTLHDIGHQDGIDFLVMEFLDGETLSARLTKGPIPPAELLAIATQLAEALDKAHRQGLIHRDLKPGNVMLTKTGAKLMDFGLAKLQQAGGIVAGVSGITRTTPLTGEGTIVGTLQYMSPEQLEGKEADARSDIFSFGTILYEMSTGKKAFEGSSQASLIASILKENPRPITDLQPLSPPMLDRVIKQCLEKDPDHRWQSAGDMKRAIVWVSEGGSQVGIPISVSKSRKTRERILWGSVVALAAVAGTLGFLKLTEVKPVPKVARWQVPPAPGLASVTWPRLSPDGTMIAFQAIDTTGQSGIYIRPINALEPHFLARIQGDNSRPFWSPDSKQIAFFDGTQLKKISIAGGLAQLICDATSGSDGSWGSKGVILFDGGRTDSVRQVPASGGTPSAASTIDHPAKEHMAAWPCFLPDGEHFLFLADIDSSADQFSLKVGSISSLEAKTIGKVNSRIEYANGYVLYVRNELLVAHPFDLGKMDFVSEPIPLSGNISSLGERALFSASNDGTLIYQRGQSGGDRSIIRVNRSGDSVVTVGPPGRLLDFSLSPDNTKIAYGLQSDQGNQVDVWIRDLKREVASRLTFGPAINVWPIWNADGSKVIFTSNRTNGKFGAWQRSANGTGTDEKIGLPDTLDVSVVGVARDGSTMVVQEGTTGSADLCFYDVATRKFEPLLTQPYSEARGQIAPNGRFLSYQTDETDRPEVYIRELTPTGGKWQVSVNRGRCAQWRADGREIFYVTPDFDFMAVPISYEHGLEIGTPTRLFNHRFTFSGGNTLFPYAVTNDGKYFYILAPTELGNAAEFVVIQNWTEELRK